jgi:L-ascorbate metabolism protein UlaG (beta-lactamase superfamily)
MIRFGPHLKRVLDALTYHGKDLHPTACEFLLRLHASPLDGDFESIRGGGNSNYLALADGRTFWFHGDGHAPARIEVRDQGASLKYPVVATIQTVREARHWVASL